MTDLGFLEEALVALANLPPALIYLAIGLGAAVENIFPPLPADTFVLFGAFLSAQGRATALGVFLVTWLSNCTSALVVYGLGRRWGPGFFRTGVGRWLLRPRQLERLAEAYARHGALIIFASRFLPGFRSLVPVFAGISRLGFFRTAIPLAAASGVWYGVLVYLGAVFGRNWRTLLHALEGVNTVLLILAGVLAAVLALVWWRSRHHPQPEPASGEGDS